MKPTTIKAKKVPESLAKGLQRWQDGQYEKGKRLSQGKLRELRSRVCEAESMEAVLLADLRVPVLGQKASKNEESCLSAGGSVVCAASERALDQRLHGFAMRGESRKRAEMVPDEWVRFPQPPALREFWNGQKSSLNSARRTIDRKAFVTLCPVPSADPLERTE